MLGELAGEYRVVCLYRGFRNLGHKVIDTHRRLLPVIAEYAFGKRRQARAADASFRYHQHPGPGIVGLDGSEQSRHASADHQHIHFTLVLLEIVGADLGLVDLGRRIEVQAGKRHRARQATRYTHELST